ncbi:MAG: serine/threonine-protein phosphatase [Planctomycetota bacterium]|nr:MAG: serine/threonine-protein phosphatase [Planctomycetota bacterium]REK20308.1 MAG: serine/threonine-protein phosphatase [Planctomycetota bacterium]
MMHVSRPARGGMRFEQKIQYATATDIGLRRQNNEDASSVRLCNDEQEYNDRGHLFIVADGMGGHAVGELASRLAVETVPHTFYKNKGGDCRSALLASITTANSVIHTRGSQNRDFQRMGTTCTALALTPRGAVVGHVGDSRAYRIRRDRIDQLTFDHSLQWELERTKATLPEELKALDNSNVITRSLGPEPDVEVDVEGPHVILPGDVYVVCSDGLTGRVTDEEIGAIAREFSPSQACRLLIHLANLRGGVDNCTVIVVHVGDPPANLAPQKLPTPETEGESLGWGWLAAFWLVSMTFVAGLSLLMFQYFVPGTVTTLVGASGLVICALYALRQRRESRREAIDEGKTADSRPHRTAVAMSSAVLAEKLTAVEADLRRAAQEEGWNVDWDAHRQAIAAAVAAANQKRFAKCIRDIAKALDLLMQKLPRRKSAASNGAKRSPVGQS